MNIIKRYVYTESKILKDRHRRVGSIDKFLKCHLKGCLFIFLSKFLSKISLIIVSASINISVNSLKASGSAINKFIIFNIALLSYFSLIHPAVILL